MAQHCSSPHMILLNFEEHRPVIHALPMLQVSKRGPMSPALPSPGARTPR